METNPGAGEPIGEFEVTSGKLFVTDPCYERGTWCAGELKNVSNGTWEAFVLLSGREERVGQLSIRKKGVRGGFYNWCKEDIDVGVDSGQAGFFDVDKYPANKEEQGEYGEDDTFYGKCCNLTLDKDNPGGGTLEFGAVSSTGWGDGSYVCYTSRDKNGDLVAACIDFLLEDDEEEPCCERCGTTTEQLDDDGRCWRCAIHREVCEECGDEKEAGELDDDLICDECRSGQNENEDE